jgi:hypothetical protein
MTIADMIYQQVQTMPDALAQEVLDFAEYLKFKWKNASKTTSTETEPNSLRDLLEQCPFGSRTSQEIDKEFQALRDEWGSP